MARTEQKLRCCALTQALNPEYWDWTDPVEIKALQDGDTELVGQIIYNKLTSAGCKIIESYIIKHDKDVYERWDDQKQEMVVDYKTNHIHNVIKFEGAGLELSKIASITGLEPNFVEKAGKGKYAYDNLLSYLTHIKYTDKHLYDPHEVVTIIGKDYVEVYHEREKDWIKGRAKIKVAKSRRDADWLVTHIAEGLVTRGQIYLDGELYSIYHENMRRCNDAFTAYAERKAYKASQSLKNGDFKLTVIFIWGLPGIGKSRIADKIIDELIKDASVRLDEKWTVYQGATSNPMDDYMGEEIIYLDDLRGSAMAATDWLLLLDPYRSSPMAARYKNKQNVVSRVVIITSSIDPYTYFYYTKNKGSVDEALDQFIRRIEACVQVYYVDKDGCEITSKEELAKVINSDGTVKDGLARKVYSLQTPIHGKPEMHWINDAKSTDLPSLRVKTRYNFKEVNPDGYNGEEDMVQNAVDLVMYNHNNMVMKRLLKERGMYDDN